MRRKNYRFGGVLGTAFFLSAALVSARVKVAKLAEKLLFGDPATRTQAIQDFNKLPADAQERLVPDFMVALSDDNPEVRKIASRILKAMGVSTEGQIPDARKEAPAASAAPAAQDKWAEERKLKEAPMADMKNVLPEAGKKPAGEDRYADLTKMRVEESGHYADMKEQMDKEKKGAVTLDAAQLRSDAGSSGTPLSSVVDSLKDPDPWVRAQAARRLAMIRPAPVEAIPTLIAMLGDKETESRRAAVAALGSFGHLAQNAVLPLNAALSDPDATVRTLARDALKEIQPQ